MSAKPIVVIGNGWAALGAAGFLTSSGFPVCWVAGTGARIMAPLACLEWGPGVSVWAELALRLGIDSGEQRQGSYLREFRNKAFREPMWSKAPNPQTRLEVRDEVLWEPERRLVGAIDSRFSLTVGELENKFREVLSPTQFPALQKIDGVPVTGFRRKDNEIEAVLLGSGVEIVCEQVIYADRWNLLPALEGLPKPIDFLRKREPMGVLQASFVHEIPIALDVRESFFAALHKEAGETLEKHVWGYFSTDGKQSVWTLCLSPEESEDNHAITKKLRRMKSTLDRMFAGSHLIPNGISSFAATVIEEQVRFEEEAIFTEGIPPEEPLTLPQLPSILFFTDCYGPASAFAQVGAALGIQPGLSDSTVKAEGSQT